jgi:hypothetical protein
VGGDHNVVFTVNDADLGGSDPFVDPRSWRTRLSSVWSFSYGFVPFVKTGANR